MVSRPPIGNVFNAAQNSCAPQTILNGLQQFRKCDNNLYVNMCVRELWVVGFAK